LQVTERTVEEARKILAKHSLQPSPNLASTTVKQVRSFRSFRLY